jgi:hypothetical protein
MRTLIPATLIIILAALYFAALPAQVDLGRNVLMLLAGLWLVAGAAAGSAAKKSEASAQPAAAQLQQAESERSRLQAALAAADAATAEQVRAARAAGAKAADAEVVNLLALLQQKGRLLDFLMDDVTKYPDAQIGAAARVVHQGCSSVVREYFEIQPVHPGQEGGALTLTKDYDAERYRLLGRVAGEPPFTGRVLHRGWLTAAVKLPERIGASAHGATGIIAPAEVELS